RGRGPGDARPHRAERLPVGRQERALARSQDEEPRELRGRQPRPRLLRHEGGGHVRVPERARDRRRGGCGRHLRGGRDDGGDRGPTPAGRCCAYDRARGRRRARGRVRALLRGSRVPDALPAQADERRVGRGRGGGEHRPPRRDVHRGPRRPANEGTMSHYDAGLAREAVAGPIDTRQWVSYGTVSPETPDAKSTTFTKEYGPLVNVKLHPTGIPVVCRVAHEVAGNGEGEWFPFIEGDEVIVLIPEGDETAGCVIMGRLNQEIDFWPTIVAGQDPRLNNFAFRRMRTPYIFETAGG